MERAEALDGEPAVLSYRSRRSAHRRRRSAALRGAATGLIAALAVVCVRALVPGEDVVSFDPVSFPLVAAVASAGLHAVGAALPAEREAATHGGFEVAVSSIEEAAAYSALAANAPSSISASSRVSAAAARST